MYILIIARGYPSKKYKMNGIFEFDQAKALVEAGHKVIYAAIDVRSIRRVRRWGFESFKKDGVQIEAINIPCGKIPKFILDKVRTLALKSIYKRVESKYGQPDIIHAHFIGCGYITARVFEKYKVSLVLTEHYSGMNQHVLNPYLTKLGNYTYSRMDKVITVSSYLANNIKQKFGVNATVIPNIVDTTSFAYQNAKRKNSFFSFVSTGSLIERKRMEVLIEAFYNAFRENEKVKLYIYGEGPEHSYLEKMIQDYGILDKVFLMGLVDRKEIANKMSESDCFVLASKLETFGVAYIEAMAMGLPVVATKCGGPEDFLNNSNGVLIPVDDTRALTEALITIYKNVDRYDRKKISESTKNKFDSQVIAKQLTKVYEELLNNME